MILQEYEYYFFPEYGIYQSARYVNLDWPNSTIQHWNNSKWYIMVKDKPHSNKCLAVERIDEIKHISRIHTPEYFL